MTKPLLVLNASAGSGKTYSLVMTYLKLLLTNEEGSTAFSQIVAMTFTNKAAQEMKERIIAALDDLANNEKKTDNEQIKAKKYLSEVSTSLNIEPRTVVKRATIALYYLLHNYEDFTVLNTDKFNLRLIKSFERDLDIPTDFEIVMDVQQLIDEVLDELLDNVSSIDTNDTVSKLILNFVKQKLDDDSKWDIKKELLGLAINLDNEKYVEIIDDLLTLDYSENEFGIISNQIKKIEESLQSKANEFRKEFLSLNLPENGNQSLIKAIDSLKDVFKNRSVSAEKGNYFSNSIIAKIENNKGEFLPQSSLDLYFEFKKCYSENFPEYLKLKLLRKNFYSIALLKFIALRIKEHKSYKHLIQINEFNKLISNLIQNEEAPYIYERLGTRYKHFLLDEFQDTSHTQWLNTVPLIHESISNNYQNLIVGDPKQSIYRFRNGLIEQFVELPRIYNPKNIAPIEEKSRYFQANGVMEYLTENYRSNVEIVKFNNDFFNQFKEHFKDQVKNYYDGLTQNPKGKEGGYVYIISNTDFKSDEDINPSEENLLKWVRECIEDGYKPGDICILDYSKNDCSKWASSLTINGFKVVSVDSLLVKADKSVELVIAYLKLILNPKSTFAQKQFANKYLIHKNNDNFNAFKKYETKIVNGTIETFYFNFEAFVNDNFENIDALITTYESLYGLLQKAFEILHLRELNNPYLHHLSDLVYQFELNNSNDLESYLNHYETKDSMSSVQIPENDDAIKIMTGHKSKGLEFKVVIMPNLKWSIHKKDSKYLIKDEDKTYFTTLNKKNEIDAISDYYQQENAQAFLDKLNLCYVMMTRPKERLYISNINKSTEADFSSKFHEIMKVIGNSIEKYSTEKSETFELENGIKSNIENKSEHIEEQKFNPSDLDGKLWFPDIALKEDILNIEENQYSDEITFGIQLHLLISETNSSENLETTIDKLIRESKIDLKNKSKILEIVEELYANDEYQKLFENAKEVINEQVVLINEKEIKRFDKLIIKEKENIIIDFKTGEKSNAHKKQINRYISILNEIYTQKNKGILIYTSPIQIIYID